MADTTFVPGTVIESSWLNDVNDLTYSISDSADAAKGDALVAVKSTRPNTVATTQHEVNQRIISVWDNMSPAMKADVLAGTSLVDITSAFNGATEASTAYASTLYRKVDVPGGVYRVGDANGTIYVRKGQSLTGSGMGATNLTATSTGANTAPLIKMGTNSSSVGDPGGQVAEVSNLQFLGGPSAYACIDTTNCAGWSVYNVMLSSPGIGVLAGGSDGLLHDCLLDDGLNLVVVSAQNLLIDNCTFYIANYQLSISYAVDVTVSGCLFEYANYAPILLNGGSTVKNLAIDNCNFLSNAQPGTYQGAIFIACNSGEFKVSNSRFRNLPGAGIKYSTGVGNSLIVDSCTFDGLKTVAGYTQSTTMQGADLTNITTVMRDCTFRNLPGQPITLGGAEATTWIIENCNFSGNTGGSVEINITNTNASSVLIIRNCTGSGRPLINNQATVTVIYADSNSDLTGTETVTTSSTAYTITNPAAKVVVFNAAGPVTLTLPPAPKWPDRVITIRTVPAQTVTSASSNVIPRTGTVAGTAVLGAVAGAWITLRSNGVNWLAQAGS